MAPANSVSGGCPLHHRHSQCNLTLWKGQGSSLGPFYKVASPLMRTLPEWPHHFPRAPPPKTSHWRARISTYELWGNSDHDREMIGRYDWFKNFSSAAAAAKSTSVVSDSVRPLRWRPARLSHPWDSPGKNTGMGCHFLLQCMKVKGKSEVVQSCLTLSDPMDCSLPGSSVHGIFQARVL